MKLGKYCTYTSEPSGRINSREEMMNGAPGNASMVALKTCDDTTSPSTGTMASHAAQKLNIRAEEQNSVRSEFRVGGAIRFSLIVLFASGWKRRETCDSVEVGMYANNADAKVFLRRGRLAASSASAGVINDRKDNRGLE